MSPVTAPWPVDGHVHFHDLDRVGPSLAAAARNFHAACGRRRGLLGALLLAQSAREQVFESLRGRPSAGGWAISAVATEPQSLIARQGDVSIAIVCGRQVRAADGLEVLAIGTCDQFADGRPFPATLESVITSGALAVVPWGFGKWAGDRGRRVADGFRSAAAKGVFVGDNGSRLGLLGVPSLIRSLEQSGARVLPGTDPFPIAADYERVGRFGFLAEVEPVESSPWQRLRDWLVAQPRSPQLYGEACGPARFLRIQGGIQIHNRLLRGRAA